MSDDPSAAYGIDMIPSPIPDFAVIDDPGPVPSTEAERHEHVNADVLRRALHVRMDALIRHVRSLPSESPINVRNIVRMAAQDLEQSVERYLGVERNFRKSRS